MDAAQVLRILYEARAFVFVRGYEPTTGFDEPTRALLGAIDDAISQIQRRGDELALLRIARTELCAIQDALDTLPGESALERIRALKAARKADEV